MITIIVQCFDQANQNISPESKIKIVTVVIKIVL